MPTFHLGRFIDHVHLRCADLGAAARFYDASRSALGLPPGNLTQWYYQADELFVSPVDPAEGIAPTHVHLAFQAADRATVDAWYEAVLAAGGTDNGPPGERKEYHGGYYAAYALDPDGNNIEAVCHGPGKRSAASVEVEA